MTQSDQTDDNIEHKISLHKLYVEMADNVSHRRENSNKFFLTLTTAPVAVMLLASRIGAVSVPLTAIFLITGIVGVAISAIWYLNLTAYAKLNRAKFKVIHEIEEELPHPGFKDEWEYLESDGYRGLTSLEKSVPLITSVAYTAPIIYAIIKWICQ